MSRGFRGGRTLVCAAIAWLMFLGCGDSERMSTSAENSPRTPTESPFAHIREQSPGGRWLAPAKNQRNLVREFRVAGSIYLVGVPLSRFVAVAYDVHPRDVKFEPEAGVDDTGSNSYYDAVVHSSDQNLETARGMLRALIAEQLELEVRREHEEAMSGVLSPAPGGVPLEPSSSNRDLLELREGELRAVGSRIARLVYLLRDNSEIPIVDETSLKQHYDFLLEWDPKRGAYAFIQSLGDLGLMLMPGVREVEHLIVTRAGATRGKVDEIGGTENRSVIH